MEVCNKDRYPIFWQSAYFIHYWHSHSRSGQTREMSLSRIYFIYSCSRNSKINKTILDVWGPARPLLAALAPMDLRAYLCIASLGLIYFLCRETFAFSMAENHWLLEFQCSIKNKRHHYMPLRVDPVSLQMYANACV